MAQTSQYLSFNYWKHTFLRKYVCDLNNGWRVFGGIYTFPTRDLNL